MVEETANCAPQDVINQKCTSETLKSLQIAKDDKTNEMLREMATEKVRHRMEKLHADTLQELDRRFNRLVDDCVDEVRLFDVQRNEMLQLFQDQSEPLKRVKSKGLPEKEFIPCNSLLTDLFEVKHIRTIYNIFIVILLMLLLNTLVHDLVAYGSFNVGLMPIRRGFGKIHIAAGIWCGLQLASFGLYFMLKQWAVWRQALLKSDFCPVWNISCVVAFVYFQLFLIYMTVTKILEYDIPAASSIALLMELVRFLMKNHAFVRSNVPEVLSRRSSSNGEHCNTSSDAASLPSFSTFLYYLFAPTLIYRHSYPRTKRIRWSRVAWHACEVIGVVFYVSFIFERFLFPYFRDFGTATNVEPSSLVCAIFGCVLPGTLANLCGFYCLLHAWMNGSAEMLRFADRLFYRDWWNASSFDVYYRTWNVVVHDWLYTYVYKDMVEHVFKGSRTAATLVVFTVSAIFHEFILAISFRFFYPVLFTLFQGAGVTFMFVRIRRDSALGNIFVWSAIAFGNGLLISLYSMEYFARQNCQVDRESMWEYFVPVSWRCNGVVLNEGWSIQSPWS